MQGKEANPAGLVTKQHEIFAHDAHTQRHVFERIREGDRVPKAAQVLATWRAGPDMRQFRIFAQYFAGILIRVVWAIDKLRD